MITLLIVVVLRVEKRRENRSMFYWMNRGATGQYKEEGMNVAKGSMDRNTSHKFH